MYLKVYHRKTKSGIDRIEYRLTESYRIGDKVHNSSILNLGTLDEFPSTEQKQQLCKRIEDLIQQARTGVSHLFQATDLKIEEAAHKYFKIIQQSSKIDIPLQSNIQKIYVDSIENRNVREVGAEWMCKQTLDHLEVNKLLEQNGWQEHQIALAYTHIISRAVYPASEYKTTSWIQQNSSVCELTNYPMQFLTKDKLYATAQDLYKIKDELEQHLSHKTNELFDIDDKVILYDLTNTYFEGSMRQNPSAKFGRSKEKRNDARLIVLALVVNEHGFLKYSQLFDGNIADNKTLVHIITELSSRTSSQDRNPTIVLDAGIATEDNLTLLSTQGFKYMCVSRSSKKKYEIDTTRSPVIIKDNRDQSIQIQKIKVEGSNDTYYRVESEAKRMKEKSMNNRFAEKFEQGLEQIKSGLYKKSGIKTPKKVWERIGRLKQKYPSIHKHYQIEEIIENDKVIDLKWKIDYKTSKTEGQYLLRTNYGEHDEKLQWKIYNTIREIESTFRVLKTDLDLRPIYHKTQQAGMAHLHLGLLAYWLVNTIRHQLKTTGINKHWKEVVRVMNTQKLVTTSMTNVHNQTIIIRQSSEPVNEVKIIYKALNLKEKPYHRKKFVVPPPEPSVSTPAINQELIDH